MDDIYDIEYYEEQINHIEKFKGNNNLIKINEEDIKINDKIIIYFYPCSQKYYHQLYPKYGKVININNKYSKLFDNIELLNDFDNYNASHGIVSDYSRGYDYTIYKIN
jgi:hypothetical protein